MSYQVLARKYRPQRFDDVIGQKGVTQTLRNALAGDRIGQSFIFAGPRGVGKTTLARILARALNCAKGPTPDPCGTCDACVEIAQGRSINVLEIDAASHTGIDKVRETIVEGLGLRPVRDRYKAFIIDEVHRLSQNAFDALLKSVEEPPPHVVFMMATTELDKVPQTIQSRSLVFELKAIGFKAIVDRLRDIATREQIGIDDAALTLLARAAEGSLRDGLSALDQVVAFAAGHVTAEHVATVLGLVRRDLLLDIVDTVAREDAAAIFDLAGRTVEAGYDLRLVCRELARIVRDLLVIRIDPSRLADPEIAVEGERDRLKALAARYSNEDLMRSFDVLSRAEFEVRGSAQPRYHLEMALLRWIHLRKLVPLTDLIESLQKGGPMPVAPAPATRSVVAADSPARAQTPPAPRRAEAPADADENGIVTPPGAGGDVKEKLIAEIRRVKKFFYGTVVAQAQKIEIAGDRVAFTFASAHKALRAQLDQSRGWLEPLASQVTGRQMTVVGIEGEGPAPGPAPAKPAVNGPGQSAAPSDPPEADLRKQALANPGVQAMLDVFAAEITKIEEL